MNAGKKRDETAYEHGFGDQPHTVRSMLQQKGKQKRKTTERKEMAYFEYEKKRVEMTIPNGSCHQKFRMKSMKQRAGAERSKRVESGSGR